MKANEFYATLEDYRETQSEPYKEVCREVLCQIEEEIDELVPFMKTADASAIRIGKLYIMKRNVDCFPPYSTCFSPLMFPFKKNKNQ